ncbi:MAG: cobalt-precorrin 5A hydrolase [Desulfomonilaceae bacterium]
MIVAVITFSAQGAQAARKLVSAFPQWTMYVHETTAANVPSARPFHSVSQLVSEIFRLYAGLVFIGPVGVAVRAIAPHLKHKTQDPAVVVVDVLARWAVSLVSGHEGGANDLAITVGNVLSAEPVISTTTEAIKNLIVGIGCRRGVVHTDILNAIQKTLTDAHLELNEVRLLSSVDRKSDEEGLLTAARRLGIPLRFITSDEIRNCHLAFRRSSFVEEKINVPAVAEPCALLAGRRTQLIVGKTIFPGVTIAIARESCSL